MKSLDEINNELITIMESQGFSRIGTGGGCTAWAKQLLIPTADANAPYMTAATLSESALFDDLDEVNDPKALLFCLYDDEGNWLNDSMPMYYSFEDFKWQFGGD